MSQDVPETKLTNHRRRMLIHELAIGTPKVQIAKKMGVDRRTIWRWMNGDPAISEAVEDSQHEIYERALAEFEGLAFAETEITPAVKFRALERIIDRHEARARQSDGQVTMAGAERVLQKIAAVLLEARFGEARLAVIKAFEKARDEGEAFY